MKTLRFTSILIATLALGLVAHATPQVELVFNTPGFKGNPTTTILDKLVDLIGRSVPGSSIKISIYEFNLVPFAEALVKASQNGVKVELVVDAKIKGDAAKKGKALNVATTGLPPGAITYCSGGGCKGSHINHNKFFLFSQLSDGSRDVVAQSSSNMADDQLFHYNDLAILKNDAKLYQDFVQYWTELRNDAPMTNDPHDYKGDSFVDVLRFPRRDMDPVLETLKRVTCDAPNSLVRVVESRFDNNRAKVAIQLNELAQKGCDVKVIARVEPMALSPGSKVKSALGANLIILPYKGSSPSEKSVNSVHAKIVMIDAMLTGEVSRQRIVMAGSHNLNQTSLTKNDEVILKMADRMVFDSYLAFWNRIYSDAITDGVILR